MLAGNARPGVRRGFGVYQFRGLVSATQPARLRATGPLDLAASVGPIRGEAHACGEVQEAKTTLGWLLWHRESVSFLTANDRQAQERISSHFACRGLIRGS